MSKKKDHVGSAIGNGILALIIGFFAFIAGIMAAASYMEGAMIVFWPSLVICIVLLLLALGRGGKSMESMESGVKEITGAAALEKLVEAKLKDSEANRKVSEAKLKESEEKGQD